MKFEFEMDRLLSLMIHNIECTNNDPENAAFEVLADHYDSIYSAICDQFEGLALLTDRLDMITYTFENHPIIKPVLDDLLEFYEELEEN